LKWGSGARRRQRSTCAKP